MANFRLHDPDCVMIHIHKTGGTTIRRHLWQGRFSGRAFGETRPEWQGLYTFAFVRHPLDRFVSAYSYFSQQRGFDGTIEDFAEITLNTTIDHTGTRSSKAEIIRHHTIQQTHRFYCLTSADDLYRFEDFDNEIARLAEKTGLKYKKIPHANRSDHGLWEDHIKGPLLDQLCAFYARDFAELGYPAP